jgi:vesicle-associated membrane protein 4
MQDNIDVALRNCVKLESIEAQAEELQQQAGVFKKSAHELKNKMWWKNMKMWLIIAFIVLVILGIIIGVAVAYSKKN